VGFLRGSVPWRDRVPTACWSPTPKVISSATSGPPVPDLDVEAGYDSISNALIRVEEPLVDAALDDVPPGLEDELGSHDAQLRETTASIDRYLRAFEAGSMPEAICAPRLAELSDRRAELTTHRDHLQVQLRSTAPVAPSRQETGRARRERAERPHRGKRGTDQAGRSPLWSTESKSAPTAERTGPVTGQTA